MKILMIFFHSHHLKCQKTPGKIPICKVCNKEFKSRTILYRHRQTHMEKLIQCGSCHKMFSTVSQIQSHQAKLKHEKIFKCCPCLITFTSVNDLKVNNRKPFSIPFSFFEFMNCAFNSNLYFTRLGALANARQLKREKEWNIIGSNGHSLIGTEFMHQTDQNRARFLCVIN